MSQKEPYPFTVDRQLFFRSPDTRTKAMYRWKHAPIVVLLYLGIFVGLMLHDALGIIIAVSAFLLTLPFTVFVTVRLPKRESRTITITY